MADAEEVDHALDALAMPPVQQVRPHRQMREQPRLLEYVARPAPLDRDVDPVAEQQRPRDRDPPPVGPQQPGDHVQHARLADPGRPKQHRRPGPGRQRQRDLGLAEPRRDVDLKGHAAPRPARRASSSDATSAARLSATEIADNRHTIASPPGCWSAA